MFGLDAGINGCISKAGACYRGEMLIVVNYTICRNVGAREREMRQGGELREVYFLGEN